jgi:serine/threonine-protein kinase
MTQSPAHQPEATRSSTGFAIAMVAAGVLGVVGLAGIGAAMIAKKPHATPVAVATTATAGPLTPVDPSTGAPTGAATGPNGTNGTGAASGSPLSAPADRTVSLAISPANAVVEVDGVKHDVVDGAVQLKGPLGAVVNVHVTSSAGETTQPIAITEGGAIPPKIGVTPPTTATAVVAAAPGTGRAPTRPASPVVAAPKPPASGSPLNAQRTFE